MQGKPLIPTLSTQRQEDLFDFKPSLMYPASCRATRAFTWRSLVLPDPKTIKKISASLIKQVYVTEKNHIR